MDEFVKTIKIKFEPDMTSYRKYQKMVSDAAEGGETSKLLAEFDTYNSKFYENLQELTKTGQLLEGVNADYLKALHLESYEFDKKIETLEKTAEVLKQLNTAESLKAASQIEKQIKSLQKDRQGLGFDQKSLKDTLKDFTDSKLKRLGQWFLEGLESTFSNAWEEMNNMLGYTRLSNRDIREQAFTYGFGASQNYAFDKVKSLLGIQSDEDLYYMDEAQRAKFQEKFIQYSEKYNKLYDKGFFRTLEEFNWERTEFQEELEFTVIEFFMNNKDIIKGALKAMINLSEWFLKAFGWLINGLGNQERSASQRAAATSQIINKYASSSSKNVSIDNTFNNTSNNDRQFFTQSLSMMKEQILAAL